MRNLKCILEQGGLSEREASYDDTRQVVRLDPDSGGGGEVRTGIQMIDQARRDAQAIFDDKLRGLSETPFVSGNNK